MENKFLIQIFLKGKYVLKVGLWYPVWAHKQIFLQKITREIGKYVPKVGSGLVWDSKQFYFLKKEKRKSEICLEGWLGFPSSR